MTLDKRTRAQMRAHCLEIHDDDGVDPREFFRRSVDKPSRDNRKARQLCAQVAQTLDLVLSGEIQDELVGSLRVASVVPAPDSSHLLATLVAAMPAAEFNRDQVERRLADHRGRLRAAVAAAITRRNTPAISFQVMGPDQRLATSSAGDCP